MDPVALKEGFGDRLCFQGGISVQTTLPFGTPEEVRQEVEERIRVLGRNGGYILGPSHAIQAGTPPRHGRRLAAGTLNPHLQFQKLGGQGWPSRDRNGCTQFSITGSISGEFGS